MREASGADLHAIAIRVEDDAFVVSVPGAARAVDLPFARLYRRGIIMNVTNPKVSIFFLAFLPQFADPGFGPLAPQIVLLGGLFIAATILIFGGISLFAGACGDRLRESARAKRLLNVLAGSVFAGLAIKLALTGSSGGDVESSPGRIDEHPPPSKSARRRGAGIDRRRPDSFQSQQDSS